MPLLLAILSITMMFSTSYDDGIVFSREVIVQSASYVIGVGLILIISVRAPGSTSVLWMSSRLRSSRSPS